MSRYSVNYKHCINSRWCRVSEARLAASIHLRSPPPQRELPDTRSVCCPFLSHIAWNMVSTQEMLL